MRKSLFFKILILAGISAPIFGQSVDSLLIDKTKHIHPEMTVDTDSLTSKFKSKTSEKSREIFQYEKEGLNVLKQDILPNMKDSSMSTHVDNVKQKMGQKFKKSDIENLSSGYLKKIKSKSLIELNSGEVGLNYNVNIRKGFYPNVVPARNYSQWYVNSEISILGIPLNVQTLQSIQKSPDDLLNGSPFDFNQPVNYFKLGLNMNKFTNKTDDALDEYLKSVGDDFEYPKYKQLEKIIGLSEAYGIDQMDTEALERTIKDIEDYQKHNTSLLENEANKRARRKADTLQHKFSDHEKYKNKLENEDYDINALKHALHTYEETKNNNPEALKKYSDYRNLKNLQNNGGISESTIKEKALPFPYGMMRYIKHLEVGNVTPYFSEFVLSNQPIKGAEVVMVKNKLYLSYAGNLLNKSLTSNQQNRTSMHAGEVGVGEKEDTHLHFSVLQGKNDRPFGSTLVSETFDSLRRPKKNLVIGTNAKYHVNKFLSLTGEVARSSSLYDSIGSVTQSTLWTSGQIDDQPTTGHAIGMRAIATIKKNTITLSLDQIGNGFNSLGVAFLRNDRKAYEVSIHRSFFGRQMDVEPFYGQSVINMSKENSERIKMNNWGAKMRLSFKKMPQVMVSYRQSLAVSGNPTAITTFNTTANYTVLLGFTQLNSNISASMQKMRCDHLINNALSNENVNKNEQSANVLNFSHQVMFRNKMGVSATMSYNEIDQEKKEKWITLGCQVQKNLFNKWENIVTYEKSTKSTFGAMSLASLQSSLQLTKHFECGFSIIYRVKEPTTYKPELDNSNFDIKLKVDYKEFLSQINISYHF